MSLSNSISKDYGKVVAQGSADLSVDQALTVAVHGHCMGALLLPRGKVQVAAHARYWPGDVVIGYWPQQGLRAHRVIGGYRSRRQWKIVTQADLAKRPDSSLPSARIIGKIIGGDCHSQAVKVPFHHRLWAFGRFVCFALAVIIHRFRQ